MWLMSSGNERALLVALVMIVVADGLSSEMFMVVVVFM